VGTRSLAVSTLYHFLGKGKGLVASTNCAYTKLWRTNQIAGLPINCIPICKVSWVLKLS
jgi:hypothetical protein